MPGRWEFNKADPSSVRVEITQRDQFNNDEVALSQALVREVIQNSSDAADGSDPVKVRFALKELSREESRFLHSNVSSLLPHLSACDLDVNGCFEEPIRALAIEDFNTKGLTGAFDQLDNGNFDNFWRAVGRSEKSGQKGGRWGLGKLVYSSASQIRTFFGLTFRKGDARPALMGQAVLKNHQLEGSFYQNYGLWFKNRAKDEKKLQLPVVSEKEISSFREIFDLERNSEPGLSIVIPYLLETITAELIIVAIIQNYYFPILAGKLSVQVGEEIIDAATFLTVAKSIEHSIAIPFEFIKGVSDALRRQPSYKVEDTLTSDNLSASQLTGEQLTRMKESFSSGELVHVRVPIELRTKSNVPQTGYIHLFLEDLGDGENPFSLFARGPITLTAEKKPAGVVAKSALISGNDCVAEFLGDAENPAHTQWNSRAEKLTSRWRNPGRSLRIIKQSVRELYLLVSDQKETQEEDALLDFFSLVDEISGNKRKKKRMVKPKIQIHHHVSEIRIVERDGGFDIVPGPDSLTWVYPIKIRVRLAYDMIGANPFKRFSPFDFDLNSSVRISMVPQNGKVTIDDANVLVFEAELPDFRLSVQGFDPKRDLLVEARV